MSTDRESDERLIDASPEFAAGYGAAMYDVWRRFPPPGLMRDGLTEPELIRLIAFVESCLPSPNATAHVRAVASNVQQIVGNSGGDE